MSHTAVRIVVAVVFALSTLACGSASTNEPSDQGGEQSNEELATNEYEFDRLRAGEVSLDGSRPDGGIFYVDGPTIYVHFPGTIGNIEEDPCVSQYDMTAEETADDVKVTLYYLEAKDPPPEGPCDSDLSYATMSVDLADRLGERTLKTGSHIVNPAFVDARLEPSWIPDGWTEFESYWDPIRGGERRYGQVTVVTRAMADGSGVEIVRGNAQHVDISVRGVNDGAVVTRERSGEHRLGFEEAGWFYDFIAEPGVDRDLLIEFAQGFELPGTTAEAE